MQKKTTILSLSIARFGVYKEKGTTNKIVKDLNIQYYMK